MDAEAENSVTWLALRRDGITREVLLLGQCAIKIPKCSYGWSYFLRGLLANMQEKAFSDAAWPELCPVVFALPGGWLNVMRRAVEMTDAEFESFDYNAFVEHVDYTVPAERKSSSFGWLDGRPVVIDYGS